MKAIHILTAGLAMASLGLVPTASAVEPGVSVEVGWEYLNVPNTKYSVFKRSSGAGGQTLSKLEDHDGEFNGVRIDMSVGIGDVQTPLGAATAWIKGFYAWHEDTQSQQCQSNPGGAAVFCTITPLFDPNPAVDNLALTQFGVLNTFTADKEVDHWGIAVELESTPHVGGLNDGPVVRPVAYKGGLAFRRIDQDLKLTGRHNGTVAQTVNYREDLETDYLGAYVGLTARHHVGRWTFLADGEVGFYWAHTDYQGTYAGADPNEPAASLNQSLSLDEDEFAVIAALKLSVERDCGGWKLAVFGRGEVYSYAPEVAYNDTETSRPGFNNGTSLDGSGGSAWAFSAGGRVTIPFAQP